LKIIKKLNLKELPLVNKFLLEEIDEFSKFIKIGWNFENLKNHFEKENNFSLGYFSNNILCAVLIGEKISNSVNFDLEMHIMYVSKLNRGINIGSSIINFIHKNKKINRISKIYLEVSEKNLKAIKFYQKNNFVFLKIRHNYYKYNNKVINAKCFQKEFK
tara:strand:- start:105 stop:584 length:480 start_codon:yes stop_codon:yes gene_type:complete